MRAVVFATLIFTSASTALFAQDRQPLPQEPPTPSAQVVAAAPPPSVVVVYVPYVVFVPVAPAHHVHRTLAPPSPSAGIFAGKPATGIFANQPATGIFVTPPPQPRQQ